MNRPEFPKTPKQARQWFTTHGICIADWCKENQLDREAVIDLLRGKRKGLRGKSHRAAIMLGLKPDPAELEEKAA